MESGFERPSRRGAQVVRHKRIFYTVVGVYFSLSLMCGRSGPFTVPDEVERVLDAAA
jgi:hypothetical protein